MGGQHNIERTVVSNTVIAVQMGSLTPDVGGGRDEKST